MWTTRDTSLGLKYKLDRGPPQKTIHLPKRLFPIFPVPPPKKKILRFSNISPVFFLFNSPTFKGTFSMRIFPVSPPRCLQLEIFQPNPPTPPNRPLEHVFQCAIGLLDLRCAGEAIPNVGSTVLVNKSYYKTWFKGDSRDPPIMGTPLW